MDLQTTLKNRDEIPEQYRWAISDLYPTDEAWNAEYTALEAEIPQFASHWCGKLGQSLQTLADALCALFQLEQRCERLVVYANQKLHEDTANAVYQGFADRAQRLSVALSSSVSFVEPEILSIPEDHLQEILEGNMFPEYKRTISEIVRNRKHVLSYEMEQLLSSAGEMAEGASDTFSAFTNADLKFPMVKDETGASVELTEARYVPLLKSHNPRVRKDAFEALFSTYASFQNTLAATFSANIKKEIFYSKARRFSSTREASLFYSRIPLSVYDNLVSTINNHLDLLHRYVALRKRVLAAEPLHIYDMYVPIVQDVKMKLSYADAKKLVKEALSPLGKSYQDTLQEAFDSRWIDVYENRGKRGGAYSWGAYGVHPYVLLNHKDDLNGAFTLAHEMGHALHSYYSDQSQPYQYAGYKLFVAEVASTVNESLLMQYMLNRATDRKERLYLLGHYLEEFRATVFRQTMFAEFEQIVHASAEAGEPLTAQTLCDTYLALNKRYFGPELVLDKGIEMEWARIPHFYTPFYVYQYATGFSAATALSNRILEKGEPAVNAYLSFLRGGSSADPIELLQQAGVDMASPEPIEKALALFEALLGQLESEL